MKKFSLKALGASLLALGLVVAGAAVPAQAAASVSFIGAAPTFSAGASPAMDIRFVPTSSVSTATFRQVNISIRDLDDDTSMPMGVTNANLSSGTLAGCKLIAITGTNVEPQNNTCTTYNLQDPRQSFSVANIGQGSATAYGSFDLKVAAGLFNGLSNGTYKLWVATTNDNTILESAMLTFTVGPPPTPSISPPSVSINGTAGTAITPTAGFTNSNFVGSVTYAAANRPAGLSSSPLPV